MFSSAKVFIWDHKYASGMSAASQESIADLKEFFTSETIFSYRPDITVITEFPSNMLGIAYPVLVVPGGSTHMLAHSFAEALSKTTLGFKERYHFIGSCAGGFIGADSMNLFEMVSINYGNPTYHEIPEYVEASYHFSKGCVKAITDYTAVGPFRPTDAYRFDEPKPYLPHRVQLEVNGHAKPLTQLYVNGAGFIPNHRVFEFTRSTVVATYRDRNRYCFAYSSISDPDRMNVKEYENLAAMVSVKAEPGKHGARFLSGTHFEACVPDSKMLGCFKPGSKYASVAGTLSQEELDKFESEREDIRETMEGMLRETFKPRG